MNNTGYAIGCGVAVLLLGGCGGGGGSGSDDEVLAGGSRSTLVASQTRVLNVSLPENETLVVEVSDGTEALALSGAIPGVGSEYRDGNLILTASEVDRIVSGTLALSTGPATVSQVNVVVENSSAEPVYKRSRAVARQQDLLLSLAADKQLYNHLVDLLYLRGKIRHTDKRELLLSFNPVGQSSYADFQLALSTLVEQLDLYERGQVADIQLAEHIHQTEAMLQAHSSYGQNQLKAIEAELADVLPSLSGGSFRYDASADRYSRFQSGDEFGMTNPKGVWSYWPKYRFLAHFDLDSAAGGSCSVQEIL